MNLVSFAFLVTRSDALVTSSVLVTTSKALVPSSVALVSSSFHNCSEQLRLKLGRHITTTTTMLVTKSLFG